MPFLTGIECLDITPHEHEWCLGRLGNADKRPLVFHALSPSDDPAARLARHWARYDDSGICNVYWRKKRRIFCVAMVERF